MAARKVHESIAAIKDVYRELFASVQELIEGSVIIKEGFKLTFDSSIVERTLQQDLFEKYINQGVAGSFCGKEKGATMLEELRAEYDFNKVDDAIAFAEKITSYLRHDMRSCAARENEHRLPAPQARGAEAALRLSVVLSLPGARVLAEARRQGLKSSLAGRARNAAAGLLSARRQEQQADHR